MSHERKKVSVLIPCRNESGHLEGCLRNVYDFTPPEGGFEVIVIDGMSDDGTRDVLLGLKEEHPDLIVIDNPGRTVPRAMNLGILRASGEYIVRADVRCIHPRDYLTELVSLSEATGADNVGGVLSPLGETYVQKAIAAAYRSPIAMGGALRDRGDFVGETDAVYGGCFKRERLLEVGMYDDNMVRNQDDELSFRLRKNGGRVVQSGRIKVKYYPRSRLGQLFKQFLQYGYWKVAIVRKHPGQASLRHLAPVALVAGFMTLLIASPANGYALLGFPLYTGGYLTVLGLESLRVSLKEGLRLWPGIAASIGVIHVAFGVGFLAGLANTFLGFRPRWFETLSR